MSVSFRIEDGRGKGVPVGVTKLNQLLVSTAPYNTTGHAVMTDINTPYGLVEPKTGQRIVIDYINIYGNRNVSNTVEATVTLFSNPGGVATDAEDTTIYLSQVARFGTQSISRSNAAVGEGEWVNAKTTDNDIVINIGYYYLPLGLGEV